MHRHQDGTFDLRRMTRLLNGRVPMISLIHTLAVAEHLNFRHAANALRVSQSSVSARVKALEENLGIVLFERNTRGVRLTEAGRHFVERVKTGIDELEHAIRTAGMVARGEQGRLRIGIPSLIPGGFLAVLIERYRELRPGIDVYIVEDTARDIVMRLRADNLDLAFVAGLPALPDCHTRPVWHEQLFAALPTRHALACRASVSWKDLAVYTFIVRQGGTGPQVHDHIVLRLAGCFPNLSIVRFDVERGTLLSMIAQGYGISIVGEETTLLHAAGVKFLPIFDEPEPLPFSAVWLPCNRNPMITSLLTLAGEISALANMSTVLARKGAAEISEEQPEEKIHLGIDHEMAGARS